MSEEKKEGGEVYEKWEKRGKGERERDRRDKMEGSVVCIEEESRKDSLVTIKTSLVGTNSIWLSDSFRLYNGLIFFHFSDASLHLYVRDFVSRSVSQIVTTRHDTLRHGTSRNVTSRHVTSRHPMSSHVIY